MGTGGLGMVRSEVSFLGVITAMESEEEALDITAMEPIIESEEEALGVNLAMESEEEALL